MDEGIFGLVLLIGGFIVEWLRKRKAAKDAALGQSRPASATEESPATETADPFAELRKLLEDARRGQGAPAPRPAPVPHQPAHAPVKRVEEPRGPGRPQRPPHQKRPKDRVIRPERIAAPPRRPSDIPSAVTGPGTGAPQEAVPAVHPTPVPVRARAAHPVRAVLRGGRGNLRTAFLLSEILSPPVGLRK